jgi:acetolactate synthase-1/2/3 large subunit
MSEPLPPPTTVAGELDEYLRGTATKMAQMEIELGQYRQPHRMDALSDADCAQLRLRIENCPESVVCGGTAAVRVEVENGSSREIGSFPPFPVQLAYRWLTDEGHDVGGPEALRTALKPALRPHERASYAMTIAAPDEPGRYRVRVTLVQEFLRWFDDLPSPLSAEATLVVVSSLPAPSTA